MGLWACGRCGLACLVAWLSVGGRGRGMGWDGRMFRRGKGEGKQPDREGGKRADEERGGVGVGVGATRCAVQCVAVAAGIIWRV